MSLAAHRKRNHRSNSLTPSPVHAHNQRTCKYRHGNKQIEASSSSSYQCVDCNSKIKHNGSVFGCARCKFYLCTPCFRKPACSNGHLLRASHVTKGTVCTVCRYKSKRRLTMYVCTPCRFDMCLGCYSFETCSGNHGLKWCKITAPNNSNSSTLKLHTNPKSINHCFKCYRVFKQNRSLFMCSKCKYALCGDCYQPSLTLKAKVNRHLKRNKQIMDKAAAAATVAAAANSSLPAAIAVAHAIDNESSSRRSNDEKKQDMHLFTDSNDDMSSQSHESVHDDEEKESVLLTDDQLMNHNSSYINNYSQSQQQRQRRVFEEHDENNHNGPLPARLVSLPSLAGGAPMPEPPSHVVSTSLSLSQSHSEHSSRSKKGSNKKKKKVSSKKKKKKKKKEARRHTTEHTRREQASSSSMNKQRSKKKKKRKKSKLIRGTPSLSLSGTSEISSSLDLIGLLDESCAPSEMTRIPSILTDCCICMERDKEVAFLPCGHYIACEVCAKLLHMDTGMCAICSMKIQSILKIYE